MFFGNKKSEMGEEDTLIKEVVAQEEKEETIVISDYAMERYKKSEHYNKTGLTNEEIELLFCDKEEWDNSKNNEFYNSLKKFNTFFSYIVFPKIPKDSLKEDDRFYTFANALFYGDIESQDEIENIEFIECSFNKNLMKISLGMNVIFNKCEFLKQEYNDDFNFLTLNIGQVVTIIDTKMPLDLQIPSLKELNIKDSNIQEVTLGNWRDKVLSPIKDIKIIKSTIQKLNVSNIKCEDLIIKNSDLLDIDLSYNTSIEFLKLKKSTFEEITFSHKTLIHTILMENITVVGLKGYANVNTFSIKNSSFSKMDIKVDKKFIDASLIIENTKINNNLTVDYFTTININDVTCKGNINLRYIKVTNTITNLEVDNLHLFGLPKSTLQLISSQIHNNLSLFNTFKKASIINVNLEELYVYDTQVKQLNLSHITCSKLAMFTFSKINRLAIGDTSFKLLSFECFFNKNTKILRVKGLNEENETEELSEKHFASKDSFKFFEKVTKE